MIIPIPKIEKREEREKEETGKGLHEDDAVVMAHRRAGIFGEGAAR